MAKNSKKKGNGFIPLSHIFSRIVTARSLCVAMFKTGPEKKEADNPLEFIPFIKKAEITWIDCCVEDIKKDGKKIAALFGFSPHLIDTLVSTKYSSYEDLETELGLMLPAIKVSGLEVDINNLIVIMKENLIVTIHGEKVTRTIMFAKYAETFMKKIPKDLSKIDKVTTLLIRIIDENNERNFEGLRTIEEESDGINKLLIDTKTPRAQIGAEIYKMKHALIMYLNALWASLDVVHSLRYGDAELISDDTHLLARAGMLAKDLTMHISLSEHMSEVLASGMEVMQAVYNNQLQILNNRMSLVITWLTVLGTAVLVPNTLATIYGIPQVSEHLTWHTITTTIILSSVLSGLLAYAYIKWRKIIPEKIE